MMQLYSGISCPFSQRCRIVLFEKGMDFQVIDVDPDNKPEDLAVINPHNTVPVLVERDLVLYEANIINEYIDERLPHPQLLPTDPVMRARARLLLFQMEKEIFSHIDTLEKSSTKAAEKSRQAVREQLIMLSPIVTKQKYLFSDDFSMLDIALAPLLWRLEYYGIELSKQAAPMLKYAERIFSRQTFIDALTSPERGMRK
ncbi:MAG: glutathione S-transferase N-terminal domain-containing protein [Pseudomonadota bacterium]